MDTTIENMLLDMDGVLLRQNGSAMLIAKVDKGSVEAKYYISVNLQDGIFTFYAEFFNLEQALEHHLSI